MENSTQKEVENKVFNISQVSLKLSDTELNYLNNKINKLRPGGFEGTKTDAFKLVFSELMMYEELIEQLREDNRAKHEELRLAIAEKDDLINLCEVPENAIEFPEAMARELKIIAYIANESNFIAEATIPALVYKILKHYQGQGYFVPDANEVKRAEEALNL